MKLLWLTLLCLFPSMLLISQDKILDHRIMAKADISKVNATYTGVQKLSMDVTYSLYQNYYSPTPSEVMKGFIKKDGTKYFSRVLDIATMQNDKYRIIIDSAHKLLSVSQAPSRDMAFSQFKIDSVLNYCKSVEYTKIDKNTKMYTLKLKEGPFEYNALEVFIDTDTYFLKRVNIYFRNAIHIDPNDFNSAKEIPMVQILYTNVNKRPRFQARVFDENTYIKRANGRYVASGIYKDYKVIILDSQLQ